METVSPSALKLGKGAAQFDHRNLKFASLLKRAVSVPESYDFDTAHAGIPTPMFGNDRHGDCVIAGRAHQTLRFELLEQHIIIPISEAEVLAQYFQETGGPDQGLVVLQSLNWWRSRGWRAAGNTYQISAFAELNYANFTEFRLAVFSDVGVGLGIQLPLSAQEQLHTGRPWEVTQGPEAQAGSWGGHYVYVCGYTPAGPICITWGRKQHMSWDWMAKYADEAYTIFDANNNFKKNIISEPKLAKFIATLN